jgi:hypothetical protein
MKTLTLPLAIFRDPVFAHASANAQAVWLILIAYCCERENGGVIEGAASWGNDEWRKEIGFSKRDILISYPLVNITDGDSSGEDAIVWKYPIQKQREIERKREGGKKGGSRKQKLTQPDLLKTEASAQPAKEKPKKDNRPTTDITKRIADIFHRKHSTAWSKKEIDAYKAIFPINEEELQLVEKLYASGDKFVRHTLLTFLNNFHGEVDRARKRFPQAKPQQKAGDPEGWRGWLESKPYPYAEYASARGYLKEEFHREKK